MTMDCTHVRELLLDLEPLPEDAATHVSDCVACRSLQTTLADVDQQLVAMAEVDVPEALLERTLASVKAADGAKAPETRVGVAALMWATVAGLFGAVLGALTSLVGGGRAGLQALVRSRSSHEGSEASDDRSRRARRFARWAVALPVAAALASVGLVTLTFVGNESMSLGTPAAAPSSVGSATKAHTEDGYLVSDDEREHRNAVGQEISRSTESTGGEDRVGIGGLASGQRGEPEALDRSLDTWEARLLGNANDVEIMGEVIVPPTEELAGSYARVMEAGQHTLDFEQRGEGRGQLEAARDRDGDLLRQQDQGVDEGERRAQATRTSTTLRENGPTGSSEIAIPETDDSMSSLVGLDAAGQFLAERDRHESVRTQPATGYWSNTYLPGDPGARELERRVRASSGALSGSDLSTLQLAELADQNRQPFDAPTDSALAVYVHADRRGVEGPRRVMLQVGIKGIAHRAGRRPALRVAVVLDATTALSDQALAKVRALLQALSRARQTGDEIAVHVAGTNGGVLVPAGELRHGQIAVAMRHLAAGHSRPGSQATTLPEALRSAATSVGIGEGESAALGSALVLLVTPDGSADADELSRVAHLGTLAGVTTSVVGLDAATVARVEPVALAGHGRRTALTTTGLAAEVVRAEIEAVSRVVARAVRLRIRLARGVELVDILGSRRLDTMESDRVRASERSADLRLARELGILSDRGDDEDGIQMVIPAFHAEDAHVVLLDVIVPGPGPVVDVTARFKDVVRLRNGSVDGTLSLGRVERDPGPLEVAVLKNVLAHEMRTALQESSDYLTAGDATAARARLDSARQLLLGVSGRVPELGRDSRITGDIDLASRYGAALMGAPGSGTTGALVDSMRYAATRR